MACWKPSISKIVCSWGDCKIILPGIIPNSSICCTSLPPAQDITELHVKCTCCKHILSETPFSILIVWDSIIGHKCIQKGPIYSTPTVTKKWVEFWITANLWWCLVFRREFDMTLIKSFWNYHVQNAAEDSASTVFAMEQCRIYSAMYLDIVSGLRWNHSRILWVTPPVRHKCRKMATCCSFIICFKSSRPAYIWSLWTSF